MPKRDFQHLVGCRHFQINGQADFPHNRVEVSVANMPAVFAQMDGDAIAARCLDHMGGAHRIGMHSATRISDRRNMVDIDAKAQTRRMLYLHSFRLPGFTASVAANSGGNSSGA